jgi:hypothetical protein
MTDRYLAMSARYCLRESAAKTSKGFVSDFFRDSEAWFYSVGSTEQKDPCLRRSAANINPWT